VHLWRCTFGLIYIGMGLATMNMTRAGLRDLLGLGREVSHKLAFIWLHIYSNVLSGPRQAMLFRTSAHECAAGMFVSRYFMVVQRHACQKPVSQL